MVVLDLVVDPESRGDPMCRLRRTCKSARKLADELTAHDHVLSSWAVAKEREGAQHPDRDAQFHYLNDQMPAYLRRRGPVIGAGSKKKEAIGNLKNGGREWEPGGTPVEVDVHDFPDPEVPKVVPYGVLDVAANQGFVVVGDDHDTADFAVATVSRWWDSVGTDAYPGAKRLLVTADADSSNVYRIPA